MGTPKQKRRKDAPPLPKRPKNKKWKDAPALKSRKRAQLDAARARRRVILARTAAGRAKLDALAAGADTSDLDHLPVILFVPRASETPGKPARKRATKVVKQLRAAANIPAAQYTATLVGAPGKPAVLPTVVENIPQNIPTSRQLPTSKRNPLNKGIGRGKAQRTCRGCGGKDHYISTCQSAEGQRYRDERFENVRARKRIKKATAAQFLDDPQPSA